MARFVWPLVLLLSLIAVSWIPGLAVNVLVGTSPDFVVNSNEYLNISDKYYLVMQPDCDLVLYNQSGLLLRNTGTWLVSGTGNSLNCSLWMQDDGNLVIYNFNTTTWRNKDSQYALWSQNYYDKEAGKRSFLLLGSDGNLDFYTTNSTLRPNSTFGGVRNSFPPPNITYTSELMYPTFSPTSAGYKAWKPDASLIEFPYMPAGYFLSAGNRLLTMTSTYMLELNASDCNLQSSKLLYNGGLDKVLWKTSTRGLENRTCTLELLQNGTLQIRDANSSEVYWNSTKAGDSIVSWILKLNPDDGTLSISDITNSSHILWTNADESMLPKSDRPIVWIVVGVLVGVFVLAMAVLGLYFYARECFLDPADKAFQVRLRASGGNSQALSQATIKQATKNYKSVIGRGGFGDVFYGKLPDGQEVAAKVLSATSRQSKQEFYNEIELLSKVHHKYLLSLLGYSSTRTHQVLIYEFMGGGDLQHRLQGESGAGNPLTWRQRTSIIFQVAEGLEYLHDKCSPPIIHRDIKSTNILLTDKLVAKVADFGLSKLKAIGEEDATHVTTVVKGTPGYLDPEYHETGLLTEKSDVFAFGVVLMEILTGRHHMHIAQRVGEAWRQKQFDVLADSNLGDDFDTEELVNLVELALWCVRRSSVERPFMRQIMGRLHDLGLDSSGPHQPEIELGDEVQRAAQNIELLATDSVNFSSETIPLSGDSSSSGLSFEVRHHTEQVRSHLQLGR